MDLDTLTARYEAAHYAVSNPQNAWPGASSDIYIWQLVITDQLIQIGADQVSPGNLFFRQRTYVGEAGPWSDWANFPSAVQPGP